MSPNLKVSLVSKGFLMELKLVLNEDQTDMLAEIFNMGMGQSLGALSKITGQEHEITFSIPKIEVISRKDFFRTGDGLQRMALIIQKYSGDLEGNAIFYLPSNAGKELAKLIIGTDITSDQIEKLESDAMIEIGNIFINSSVSCLSNFLDVKIETKIPEMIFQDKMLALMEGDGDIIHLNAQFNIAHLQLQGDIAFVIDNDSIQKLTQCIDRIIESGI